jgi:hypothetical protein
VSVNAQNVNVNPGAGSYATLKDAFDAINAGTHTGAVTVNILFSTAETATAALNASGVGSASYTSVDITTSNGAGVTVEGSLAGASTGAIIRLIGADNVTLDGRIGGTGRNITIRNNSPLTLSAAIWISSPPSDSANGCQNNVIRNCKISCNSKQDTNVVFSSYGIYASGATITTTPTAEGRNIDNTQILENEITKCRYGITFRGATTNLNDNNVIMNNIVGPDSFVGGNAIGKDGIYVQFQNGCSISYNEVKFVGYSGGIISGLTGGADRVGIAVGSDAWSTTTTTVTTGLNCTINGNKVHDIVEQREFSAVGIMCATTQSGPPTGNVISNNEVYNVFANGTAPDQGVGIGHVGNRGDIIVYNSIWMVGDIDPPGTATATQYSAGLKVSTTGGDTALTIKNNSIYVDLESNNAALLHYCIVMPSATYGWGSGGGDYNNYYPGSPAVGPNPQMRLGGLGGSQPLGTSFSTLAAWQGAFSQPQDANSITADPVYALGAAPPNFLIPLNGTSPLLLGATPISGITTDILNETRSAFTPTIGAYEFDETTLPVELSAFTATVSNRDVTLNWTTTTELNNSGFDIERKSANGTWSRLGFIEGNGTTNSTSNYSYNDRGLETGKYNYRLKQIDFNGNFEYLNLSNEINIGVPSRYDLAQNYPNPFNPATKISYDLPLDGKVSLKLYDMIGREVATLVNEVQTAGYYSVNFNGSSLSSGVYFYTITSNNFAATKKMMLLK